MLVNPGVPLAGQPEGGGEGAHGVRNNGRFAALIAGHRSLHQQRQIGEEAHLRNVPVIFFLSVKEVTQRGLQAQTTTQIETKCMLKWIGPQCDRARKGERTSCTSGTGGF